MQSEDDSLIREMVDTIVREANPDTVILFGSRARG
jgi:predicted nucleotidyltransferase